MHDIGRRQHSLKAVAEKDAADKADAEAAAVKKIDAKKAIGLAVAYAIGQR